ncbi:MAG: hypothetical protein HFJ95_02780 [Muribaculaceae bacterium]|nr:hypothetical protein [Muribaculaceae bacterium]
MKNFKQYILPAIALFSLGFASCNDDDEYFEEKYQDKPMKITQVYLEDYKSSVPERPVEFARLSQMLRLEGEGLFGVKKVYINGYDTYFNRAYVTDNSLIVSVNRNTPVTDCDPAVRNTIRLVKDKTELVYEFLIRNGYSIIQSVNPTLPQPGETVTVNGSYLHETSKVTLPGGIEVTSGIENDPDGEWFTFVMPSGVSEGGALISESPNGITQSPAYFNETRGMLLDFDHEGQQGAWSWKENGSMISNKVEDGDLVADPVGSGRGYCVQIVPDRLLANGISAGKPRATECHTVGDGNVAWEDWSRMADLIPATTPVTEVAFQVDILCPEPWSGTGFFQMQLINNYNFAGFGSDDDGKSNLVYCFAPWLDGWNGGEIVPFTAPKWTTLTIPLSYINKYATLIADPESATPTFQMVIDDRLAATYPNFGIGFINTDFDYTNAAGEKVPIKSTAFNGPKIYLDNWRIVPYKHFEPSDYEEPEDEQ